MPNARRFHDRRPAHPVLRRLAIAAAPLLVACASAGQGGENVAGEAAPSLCATPTVDPTAFRQVDRGGYSVGIPRPFAGNGSGVDAAEFRAGPRRIVLLQGNYPTLFADGSVQTVLKSTCTATIGGRPVEIVSLSYDVPTQQLESPGPETGLHFVVGARWGGVLGGRDVSMWIDTKFPAESRRLRAMFWTVHFKGDSVVAGGTD